MISHSCCAVHHEPAGTRIVNNDPRPAALKQRQGRRFAGLIFPSAVLVLLPKCPACLAAYVAMGTGIGLSLPAATYLRFGVLTLCAVLLACFTARWSAIIIPRIAAMRAGMKMIKTGVLLHRKSQGL